jgi:uncharacterized protein (TIGR02646 family)
MIQLVDEPPRDEVIEQLGAWQAELDAMADYATRVEKAETSWRSRNRANNPTFQSIRSALRSMSGGAERCCYCEDSLASQIEHVRPKSLYPSHTFVWSNMLWACGLCNNRKHTKFAVLVDGRFIAVPRRRRNGPIVPPPSGTMALVDPRTEDPQAFMGLDLTDTFEFFPYSSLDHLSVERVKHTIRVLGLNLDPFPEQRFNAYWDFHARLREYAVWRHRGASDLKLAGLRSWLHRSAHQTVWREILRLYQSSERPRQLDDDFSELFGAVPEALDW